MNKVYKTVWNKRLNCSQVTSEQSRGHSKNSQSSSQVKPVEVQKNWFDFARLSLLSLALLPLSVWASIYDTQLPTGGNITVGSAQISQNNNTLNVHQNSQNVGIQWNDFNIGQNATVNFHQPNSSSIAVNRVLDSNASQIMGKLNANGQVFLLNPNGVIFSKTAQVNVGGIVASTLNVTDGDIMSGNFTLKNQGGAGKVENHGSIIANGGVIAFIAPNVINTGNVESKNGVIHFTAADQVTLHLQDGQLTEYQVDIGTLQGLIDNQGAILANNGAVYLTAKAKDSLSKAVVNHSGIIEANRLTKNAKGEIVLLADMEQGTANINGVLKAEGKNGQDGGFIETSAATVHIGQDTQVSTKAEGAKTGTWLIDPTDFTIHGGTGAATGSGIGAITLQNNLNNTSIQLETQNTGSEKGDIHVNAAVTWNKDTTLTLNAHNDININANITAQHQDGKVELLYGQNGEKNANYYLNNNAQINLQAGQNFSTQKGTNTVNRIDYTVITQLGNEGSTSGTDLQGINGDLSGNYVLGADIDATVTKDWGSFDEQGFNPIGNEWDGSFTGRFDGLGHKVSSLNIDRSYAYGVGLFGSIQDAIVRNIGVQSGSIRGDSFVGGLVGQSHNSLIENSFSRANVEGIATIGGLVGGNYDGSQIQDSHATGNVTGGDFSLYVGGLAGANDNAQIENSYATGTVKGDEIVGGLVGDNNNNAVIDRSYATGQVTGGSNVGGLAGNSYYGSEIKDSYAVGSVTGNNIVGGLVGENLAASINTSYALGKVAATDKTAGGLVAKNTQGTVNNSYWDKDRTGQTTSAGSANKNGLASQDMFKADQFIGFDFDTVWGNANDQTTPYLQNHKGSNQVIKKDDVTGAFYGVIQTIQQLQAVNNQLDGHYLIGNDIDASATQSWGDSEGNGFKSIGDQDTAFTGVIDGLGHQIKELYIDRKNSDQVGLIGINQGTVNHLSIKDANITGRDFVGGVIGQNEGQVSEIYSSGTITGQKHVGGLLGSNNQTVHEVYSTANVSGQQQVGGLVGQNTGILQDIYSTGDVKGVDQVGGLVGFNSQNANIKNAFTTGTVTGASKVGGVVGQNDGTLVATYWNTDHQQTTSKGVGEGLGDAIGLTTEQMKHAKNFSFLNEDSQLGGKDTVWRIYEGNTSPLLRRYLTTVDLSLKDKNTVYNGKEQHFADVWGLDESKYKAQGQVSGTNAGQYKATYYSDDQQGYDFIGNEGTLTIDKAKVTVTGSSETDKIYNGQNQSMSRPDYTVSGMVNGESEILLGSISASGVTGKDAGTYDNKVTGKNQSTQNYDIVYVDGKFIINKKKITVTALDETREYNGFNQQINSFKAEGLVDGENESVLANSVNALATRKDAGTYDHLAAYKNGSGDKNYDITFQKGTYTITKANATVKGNNLDTTYNGIVQNQGGYVVSGLKGNDKQGVLGNIGNTAASGKNAGQYQNTVSGAESSANYNIVYENGVLDIAKKQITGSISAQDKVYDGTTNAIVNGSLNGVITGDNVNITAQGQFSDKNAGSNKNVNVSGALNGTDAGNYALSTNLQTQANISKKQITGSITAQDKVYDGTTNAIVSGSLNGVISGDKVNITAQGQFSDKNAGSNKNVNVSGALNGTDADNYALSTNLQTQANISKKQISGVLTAQDKVYDGTTNAIVSGSLNQEDIVTGDQVSVGGTGHFVDKNAGQNKAVNASSSLIGTDAGNYELTTNGQVTANIAKKQITGSISAQDKVYDGTTNAIVNGSLNGVISGDNVDITAQGQFSDKNAGSNKNVNVSGALNGTDAGNYALSTNLQTQANISKKQITGSITAQDKV
ncbi:YDG domain-containing protein, partial [Acinetobacter sp. TY1]|uniref:YDG domain-containing protein n=1 Tax=Acinetobacter sp. TY1 TaxID=3387626 RepID=UPI003AF65E8D